ncbi:MAG: hypothetical protein ACLFUC_00215 [Bacteroidales bacterium]
MLLYLGHVAQINRHFFIDMILFAFGIGQCKKMTSFHASEY